VEDEVRFRVARAGDHLCTTFQCPNCQSQNIRGRNLREGDAQDEAFEAAVTRATLDAFWAHASRSVASHVSEVRFMERYGDALGVDPFPPLGPFPLGQHLGMKEAVMVVMRSMEKGRKKATVQFGTARKARATLTVLWETSPMSGGDIVLSAAALGGRYIATKAPAEGRWYQYFTAGARARMGDIVSQDRAFTSDVLHALLSMYELEWEKDGWNMPAQAMCAAMFLLVSCLGGMRGYEVVWTDLGALRYDLQYCEDLGDYSAISWPVVGRFKARGGVADCYMVPIAGETRSGIRFFEWTRRFVVRMAREGYFEGWAFRREDGRRAVAGDYREDIFTKLEKIQQETDLIDPECKVWEDYGVQRSGRRFFTTECAIQGASTHEIELQCRWSTDRANGERTVQRSMVHTYSEVRNMREVLVRPSKLL